MESICVICMERFPRDEEEEDGANMSGVRCPHNHYLCGNDCTSYVSENVFPQVFKVKESCGGVYCPVPGCNAPFSSIELYGSLQGRERVRYLSILSEIVASTTRLQRLRDAVLEIITLKCPTCDVTIDPHPDACSAIMCLSCGHQYCNYCFQAFATGDREADRNAAHIHCATHNTAPDPLHRDAFLPAAIVEQGHQLYRSLKLEKLLALAMASPEHGANSRQDVAVVLLVTSTDLADLDISHEDMWRKADSRLRGEHAVVQATPDDPSDNLPHLLAHQDQYSVQLWNALLANNSQAVAQLISSTGDTLNPNYIDPASGLPLVTLALLQSKTDVVIALLRAGGDIYVSNRNGRSFLHVLGEVGNIEVLRCIHELWPDTDWNASTTDEISRAPLIVVATRFNHGAFIKCLLSLAGTNIDVNQTEDECGYTALHMAALKGCDWPMTLLLQAGANQFLPANDGRIPMYPAVELGFTECVRALANNSRESLNIVLEPSSAFRSLHVALIFDKVDMALLLLQLGADPNSSSGRMGYCSPLMLALLRRHESVALEMIARGSNPSVPSEDGRLPIYVAVEMGLINAVTAILNSGVDVNGPATSERHVTKELLHLAIKFKQPNLVQLLIDRGADINAIDTATFNDSVLDVAIKLNDELSVRRLFAAGVAFRIRIFSPLLYAIERGNVSIARQLIEHFNLRPDAVMVSADHNFSALHVAAQHNQDKIIFMLMQIGWGERLREARDGLGRTPLDVAQQFNASASEAVLKNY